MTHSPSVCRSDAERRQAVRGHSLNGLDEIEVEEDQLSLRVTFLGTAPDWLEPANVVIEPRCGQRTVVVRDIRVDKGEAGQESDGERGIDDVMTVWLDRWGEPGPYRLAIRRIDARGHPAGPPPGFDPRYAAVEFDFKVGCADAGDCAAVAECPPPRFPAPNIDYLARDYAGMRRLMLDRLALTLPEWTERHAADIGVSLVEAIAAVGDQLSYYQDAVATEAYLGTARQRISIRRHARLVDYTLHEGAAAQGWAVFRVTGGKLPIDPADVFFTVPVAGLSQSAVPLATYMAQAPAGLTGYELAGTAPIALDEARNAIGFHRWGQTGCCLPRGATRATLVDPGMPPLPETDTPPVAEAARRSDGSPPPAPTSRSRAVVATAAPARADTAGNGDGQAPQRHVLALAAGQVLVFAEVIGPHTGRPEDADPTRRHPVRLTRATPAIDALEGIPVWEIEWCPQDALPFPLCLDATGDAPDCTWRDGISIAWGNVAAVDAGSSRQALLPPVPSDGIDQVCATACDPAEDRERAGRYRPGLPLPDLTFSLPVPHWQGQSRTAAATRLGTGTPDEALPALWLTGDRAGRPPRRWSARGDLLESGPDDCHFVVEVDDDRVAWLRFGDGDCGATPEAGEAFTAHYRLGNGRGTNLGAGALGLAVFRNAFPDGIGISVSNPLPLLGGAAPESVEHARMSAPQRYRERLERAITADDYAAIVRRDFASEVQRAAAVMRRTGAATEVQVAIDPLGGDAPAPDLLRAIAGHLEAYRRIGHDLRVVAARQVPLVVGLMVCVVPERRREPVAAAVRRALGPAGLFAADSWTFGDSIAASRIVATAQAIDGVAHVTLTRLERQFGGSDGAIDHGVLRLGAQDVPLLADDRNRPGAGSLILDIRGGR